MTATATGNRREDRTAQRFIESMRGPVIQPSDPAFETSRAVYNAMIDRRPSMLVECADVADVINAVKIAREEDMLVAVRGGGHNVAGLGTCDDGIVIDLAAMNGVRVDPDRKTVRVGGGATWGEVDHATHVFGLATPSGIISTTGVAGLTLGGGFGYLSRRYGLSCDNLISADVVTADGELRVASADQNADLFWAIRGGGGNFGVVTSFEFQLHPASNVYGGPIFYPAEHADKLLHFYRDYMQSAPNEMSAFFSFHQGPPAPYIPEHLHFVPMVAIVTCYAGDDPGNGEEVIRPLRNVVEPAVDLAGLHPYPALNSMFDGLYAPGLQHYWKTDYVPALSDEAISVHDRFGPRVPSLHSAMHLYPQTGAIQQVDETATAYSHRDDDYVYVIIAADADPANMADNIAWMQQYDDALRPHCGSSGYVNFLMQGEGKERVKASYGANYERLVEIKTRYDPGNLFRVNQNIEPRS
ncbi:MAG: FAD-binding oxidoreductase [Thermomicrobiales bacterium]